MLENHVKNHVKKQVIISDYTCGVGKKKKREAVKISDTKPIRLFDFLSDNHYRRKS